MILAFDVRVEREAQEMADSVGVRIFTADIIYHLFDNFMQHRRVHIMMLPPYTLAYLSPLCVPVCLSVRVCVDCGYSMCRN